MSINASKKLCYSGKKPLLGREELSSNSMSVTKCGFRVSGETPRRICCDSVVMFSSYLYLAEWDLFPACDRIENQSDYETCFPSELVRRSRLPHPAGRIHRYLPGGCRRSGSDQGRRPPPSPDACS